ncbi:TetR/AcrR family transcriptional regulator [Streptomyces sp. NPDC058653]|uniref:TetR/AcrR family transcriptional regulator n=1 Tax=Streptomyces sp. NPDC058653 TaxID=3346576 RepID=UPI0036485595
MDRSSTRRQATRQKLYDAAVTLIAEQGFSATTVDEIAERAGVAKGTVYYNFRTKNELFEELLRHGVGLLTDSLRTAVDETAGREGTSVEALDAMVRAGLAFIDRHPAFTQLYVAELWRTNRAWQATLLVVRQQAVAVVEKVLQEGIDGGELNREMDIPLTAGALMGTVLVAALDWQAFQPERSIDEVHSALSLLLHGRVGGG